LFIPEMFMAHPVHWLSNKLTIMGVFARHGIFACGRLSDIG